MSTQKLPDVAKDISNQTFGYLKVISYAGKSRWNCECLLCGNKTVSRSYALRIGRARSCGCSNQRNTKHGLSKTPEYYAWNMARRRCHNPKDESFSDYGGRGIRMCDRWRSSFINFLEDMGKRPGPQYSLERKDVNGNYELNNCIWATLTEQHRNRRDNLRILYKGETHCLAEWSEILGFDYDLVCNRMLRGYTFEEAISLPKSFRRNQH